MRTSIFSHFCNIQNWPYLEFFSSVFSHILIEYGPENPPYLSVFSPNTDQKNFEYGQFSRKALFSTLRSLNIKLFGNSDFFFFWTNILLFGKESLNLNQNSAIFNATVEFILSTKRFVEPLLLSYNILITDEIKKANFYFFINYLIFFYLIFINFCNPSTLYIFWKLDLMYLIIST